MFIAARAGADKGFPSVLAPAATAATEPASAVLTGIVRGPRPRSRACRMPMTAPGDAPAAAAAPATADGRATPEGIDGYQRIEATTDALAAVPWNALGPVATARLGDLLHPLAVACHRALPAATPIGVPVPSGRG